MSESAPMVTPVAATPAPKPAAKPAPPPRFILQSSPHLLDRETVPRMMYAVIIALLPVIVAAIWFFGVRALAVIVVATGAAMLTEALCQKARGRAVTLADGSAAITGLLLALCLPVTIPLTLAALGAVIAVTLGKHAFGGLGHNIFNPALVGRAFLQAAFPIELTTWVAPHYYRTAAAADAVTTATPLALFKFGGTMTPYESLFTGRVGGCLGETSAFAILVGGGLLLVLRTIDWRIPLGLFGTVLLVGGGFHLANPLYLSPLAHLLSGGLLLGGFFMATDLVTSPVTPRGAWIFSIGIGLLVVLIRLFGGLPEGVMYGILIMNAVTPLINRATVPRVLGARKKR